MPQMAIATGSADPFECLLLKIGLDRRRDHRAGAATGASLLSCGENSAGHQAERRRRRRHTALYTHLDKLSKYDVVMLPCEGTPSTNRRGRAAQNIVQYLNAGGRLFTTHYSYDWLTYTNSPFEPSASADAGNAGASSDHVQPTTRHPGHARHAASPRASPSPVAGQRDAPMPTGQFDDRRSAPRHRPASITMYAQRWMYRRRRQQGACSTDVQHAARRAHRRHGRSRNIAAASCSATSTSRPSEVATPARHRSRAPARRRR